MMRPPKSLVASVMICMAAGALAAQGTDSISASLAHVRANDEIRVTTKFNDQFTGKLSGRTGTGGVLVGAQIVEPNDIRLIEEKVEGDSPLDGVGIVLVAAVFANVFSPAVAIYLIAGIPLVYIADGLRGSKPTWRPVYSDVLSISPDRRIQPSGVP